MAKGRPFVLCPRRQGDHHCYRDLYKTTGKVLVAPPKVYPYFDVVVGFEWSRDPEIYAGGSVAPGMATHAGQIKCDDPDWEGYFGPAGWWLGVRLMTPPLQKRDCHAT